MTNVEIVSLKNEFLSVYVHITVSCHSVICKLPRPQLWIKGRQHITTVPDESRNTHVPREFASASRPFRTYEVKTSHASTTPWSLIGLLKQRSLDIILNTLILIGS
jgi:hypothetical protein